MQARQLTEQKYSEVCPQYLVISPGDSLEWVEIRKQLNQMYQQKYNKQKFIKFVEGRYLGKNYPNIRLLKRINTEYFWNGVTRYMVACMVKDTHLISSSINVLLSDQNTILKLTKYQIFLILCHLFMGTFPCQLYDTINKNNFGPFMSVLDDQDDITSKQALQFRLNKLKSIVRYFCSFYKKQDTKPEMKDEIVIFQRYSVKQNKMQKQVLNDKVKFCKVQPHVGSFYTNENQINAISINNVKLIEFDKFVEKPIPGNGVYGTELDYEERIFFSHPEMLILPLIMHEGLEDNQSLIMHGVEKYSCLFEMSQYSAYDFRQKYKDQSQLNKVTKVKNTTLIFVKRQIYSKKKIHNIIPDAIRVSSSLVGCLSIKTSRDKLISGAFSTAIPYNSKQIKRKAPIEMPWDMKFIVDWIAASVANFQSLHFFVESEMEAVDVRIMAEQLKYHTVRDIICIFDSYYEFRTKDKGKLTLLQFMKDFAL